MAEITRFVQEFPSLSGPYQTEPVPHVHFLPIPHESSLHSIAYRHTSSIVGTFSTVGAFSRRLCDAPTQGLAGLSLEEGKSLCQDGIIVPQFLYLCQRHLRLGEPERHLHRLV